MAAKFEVYPSKNGYRWRLKAGNGDVVATGEESQPKTEQKTVAKLYSVPLTKPR